MRRQRGHRKFEKEDPLKNWIPKTTLGKKVMSGEITSIEQVYDLNMPILEPEIVDKLVPNVQEEVLNIKMVQR